jgi:CHAD domain-containing protein
VLAAPPELAESGKTLKAVAAGQLRKLRTTMAGADAEASDELLHKARIRGKRVRYLAEALDEPPVVRRAKAFQDVVGEHQDAVVAEQRLRALGERVPEAALTLGVLVERQRERRLRTRNDLPKAWKRLRKAAAGAWA